MVNYWYHGKLLKVKSYGVNGELLSLLATWLKSVKKHIFKWSDFGHSGVA